LTEVFKEKTDRRGFCWSGLGEVEFRPSLLRAGVAGLIKTVLAIDTAPFR
jgi:hypothetical protein